MQPYPGVGKSHHIPFTHSQTSLHTSQMYKWNNSTWYFGATWIIKFFLKKQTKNTIQFQNTLYDICLFQCCCSCSTVFSIDVITGWCMWWCAIEALKFVFFINLSCMCIVVTEWVWFCFLCLSSAYPAVYGQFPQAIPQPMSAVAPAQREGKDHYPRPSLHIHTNIKLNSISSSSLLLHWMFNVQCVFCNVRTPISL